MFLIDISLLFLTFSFSFSLVLSLPFSLSLNLGGIYRVLRGFLEVLNSFMTS